MIQVYGFINGGAYKREGLKAAVYGIGSLSH